MICYNYQMELRHLRYFVAVAEEMNIHRAAERLHISQPPLSVAIQQLEEELQTLLFTREGRNIQITKAGEFFLLEARNILAQLEQSCFQTKQVGEGKAGIIKIGFISSSVTGILQQLVSQYKVLYPNVQIDLKQYSGNRVIRKISSKEIDVGIERFPINLPNELKMNVMVKEGWFAAINKSHPLSKKKIIKVTDLKNEALIFYPRWNSPVSYDDVIDIFTKKNITPNIVQEATEQMTIAALVASDMGIGVVPETMKKIKVDNIVHVPIEGTKNRTGFGLISRQDHDVLVHQFLDMAKDIKF